MKKLLVTTVGAVLIILLFCGCSSPSPQSEGSNEIRSATVLIEMQVPNREKVQENIDFLGNGIGTLIQIDGETLLITHNHWRYVLEDISIVRFYDADYNLITTIIGKQFRELVLQADPGTLVLQPPQELVDALIPVNLGAVQTVVAGDSVYVVYWEKPSRDRAAIQQAVVEEVITYQDVPVYKLRSLNGGVIQPGDSGGGVWCRGMLVGNNWMVEAVSDGTSDSVGSNIDTTRVYTDVIYAAALSFHLP